MKNNKGSEKFNFVSNEKISTSKKDTNKKSKVDNKSERITVVLDSNKKEKTNDVVKEYDINKTFYFGFRQRVITIILLIIFVFGLGSFLIINSYRQRKGDVVIYSEVSDSKYNVCLVDNEIYPVRCLDEGMLYNSSLVNTIPINFTYNVSFSEDIDYQLYYHVILYNKIYDKNNSEKILYENKEVLVIKTFVDRLNQKINIDTDVKVDFKKYYDFVNQYKMKYSSDIKSDLEVVLYLDEYDEERNVGSVTIPVSENNFEIKKEKLSNKSKTVEIENEDMLRDANISLFFGSFLVMISLILDISLVRLVKATFKKKSKYDVELNKIFKTYDKHIVNVLSDFKYDENKEVVKVESIKELVDASTVINKPIIYYKINNVKSEFILDDDTKIYKYTLKEADIEK